MKISKVNNIQPDKRTFRPNTDLVLSRRDIGIEIEAEGFMGDFHEPPTLWTLVPDGSLRDGGVELVSTILRGEDISIALTNAEEFVKKNGLIFNDRCSVHIHLDVRALDTEELVFLLSMYTLFEDFFFIKGGSKDRALNNHCRPICSSTSLYPNIKDLFSQSREEVHSALSNWSKYTALNLAPVLTQGSIEFRHHVGTGSKEEILQWINIIFSVAHYSKKNKDKDLQETIDKVCEDGEDLFNSVFPQCRGEFSKDLHHSMIENARYIQIPTNVLHASAEEQQVENTISTRQFGDRVQRVRDIMAAREMASQGFALTAEENTGA